MQKGRFFIPASWSLTAAHCVAEPREESRVAFAAAGSLTVRGGSALAHPDAGLARSVAAVVPSPDFAPATYEGDAALLRLEEVSPD